MTRGDGIVLRPEASGDTGAVRRVTAAAFGRAEEARLVDVLRVFMARELAAGALRGAAGRVRYHAAFSDVT